MTFDVPANGSKVSTIVFCVDYNLPYKPSEALVKKLVDAFVQRVEHWRSLNYSDAVMGRYLTALMTHGFSVDHNVREHQGKTHVSFKLVSGLTPAQGQGFCHDACNAGDDNPQAWFNFSYLRPFAIALWRESFQTIPDVGVYWTISRRVGDTLDVTL